jgi:hypothetical protein
MKEELVSFETAKLLKEKGFDTPLNMFYRHGKLQTFVEDNYNLGIEELCSAPTQSLAQKWLREKHNIHVEIYKIPVTNEGNMYGCYVCRWIDRIQSNSIYESYFKTYEEALEEGLKQGLMLIK